MEPTHHSTTTPLDYDTTLHRLLSLVDYERMTGMSSSVPKYDLRRMEELAHRMDDPQRCAPVVHVAGTKGKGSVAAMVASTLKAAGLRTGLFTSPHLHTFTERIRLDSAPISPGSFAAYLAEVWRHVEVMEGESPFGTPSTFEVLTAMAFEAFRRERVDVQVLEVGLGGRLDATNLAHGRVAVITSLSLDHTAVLGDQLGQIAAEKAGIVKRGATVVLSPQEPEADAVVAEVCRKQAAELRRLGKEVTWQAGSADLTGQEVTVRTPARTYRLWVPLLGAHQRENAAAAVAAVEAMELGVGVEEVVRGVRDVEWPGRFQVLSSAPAVVADGAHNPQSMARLREAVRDHFTPRKTVVVFGCSLDKDLDGMLAELAPITEQAVVCASRHPRAVPPPQLKERFEEAGMTAQVATDVRSALAIAQADATDEGLVLVTGSLFIVAEALEVWFDIPPERYAVLEPRSVAGPRAASQTG